MKVHHAPRLEDGADLHRVDLGVHQTEPAAAEAQHRVELVHRGHLALDKAEVTAGDDVGELLLLALFVREELWGKVSAWRCRRNECVHASQHKLRAYRGAGGR